MKNLIDELTELKESILNDDISAEQALETISRLKNAAQEKLIIPPAEKAGALKSLMITFNISNYSDVTIFFKAKCPAYEIIEKAGDLFLCDKIVELLSEDTVFFNGMERIELGGVYYRLNYESMTIAEEAYTVLSLSNSANFKSTSFHMLCDLIMDYNKAIYDGRKGLFNDLFDHTVIEFTKFISLFENYEPHVYFFKFEYISEFYSRIGLATIIEMSRHIKHRLIELFGNDVSIIRLSLSSYVIVTSRETRTDDIEDSITKKRIMFNFKGIILPYTVVQVPYKKDNSIYDIFENVYLLSNYLKSGDIRI